MTAEDLARRWEGLRLKSYLCPAGVWTIGYGHTAGQGPRMTCTKEQAEQWLMEDMQKARNAALLLCPSLTGYKLEAITDFVFNLGAGRLRASTLRRKINEGLYGDVPSELRKWIHGGGKKLPGLIMRREDEVRLWLKN